MGKSCSIAAHVRNSNGEIVESKLFNDLLHYTSNNREISKQYYKVGTSEEFLSKVRDREDYKTDENGEITFESLNKIAKIDLETDKVIEILNKDIKSGIYNYEDAIKKVQYFNEHNTLPDMAMATMVPSGKNSYFVSVIPITKKVSDEKGKRKEVGINSEEQQKLHKTVKNKELEKRIITLLKQYKVSVKFIEEEKEGGRYSTENISNAENGLYGLIEINETGHTTDILAEEAGHFAIGALGDYPLVRRIENLLSDEKVQRETLGKQEYEEALLGKDPAREIAGRLVGKALQRKLNGTSPIMVLANRIANLAKRVFYNITGNEVRWASAKAEQVANKIAYQFVEGNSNFSVQNAISIKETMHNAALSTNTRTYKEIVNELGLMCKRLEAISNDALAGQTQASLGLTIASGTDSGGKTALQYANDNVAAIADSLAFDGVVQAMVQITDYLGADGQIDRLLRAVNLDNPSDFYAHMARNAKYLRQARTILKSAESIISVVSKAIDGNCPGGPLKTINGTSLTDVRYQDDNGVWKSYNLKAAIKAYQSIVGANLSRLINLESAYFARFCEDIYGKKYISKSSSLLWKNIWKGKENTNFDTKESFLSISDAVQGVDMDDIDLMHSFIGSMSNNPDIIGQIVDKLVKTSNKIADDKTIRDQEKLYILKERAERLGINMDDLLERDKFGMPTGNIITPPAAPTENGYKEEDFICQAYMEDLGTDDINEVYAVDHGEWERKRDEHKKELWEKFKEANPDWKSMSGFMRGLKWNEYFGKERKKWNKANSLKVTVKDPKGNVRYVKWVPNALYKSDSWDKLEKKYPPKGGDSIRKLVYDYMQLKQELDSQLPEGATVSYRLPQFRGTFMNSVRNKAILEGGHFKKTKSWFKTFGRRVLLESFTETADDTDYGNMTTMNHPDEELLGTKLDFESERASRLPIFGVNKLKNMSDLSSDIFHSTLAYASMANSYTTLSNVVNGLEVGKAALATRDRTIKGDNSVENFKSRAYNRYCKFLDKQVYGISSSYYGLTLRNGKRILVNKILQNLSSLGGSLFLKGNVLGGAVNTLTGFNNIFKEAITSDYFSSKDWAKAHRYYFSSFVSMWSPINFFGHPGDLGKLKKNNKLDLFLQQMNALSNNREKFRNWRTSRSSLNNFYRMSGYLPYSSGDHYMQAMSYLAVANGTTLYNLDGTVASNLWNAWQKVPNTDDKNEFIKGNSLEFNRFCPMNASEITFEKISDNGAYLKEASRTLEDFQEWLYTQDSQFLDVGFKSQHMDEYDEYRKKFNKLSKEELQKYQSDQLSLLKSILDKVEDKLSTSGPHLLVSSFTSSEKEYLATKGLSSGEYKDILQVVREEIYKKIWTKADESAYMDKCREINNRLHGIYNEQDKTAWHNNLYFNAFLAMKGWALGYLEHMFSGSHYSIALNKEVEGFVNTALKIPFSVAMNKLYKEEGLGIRDMLITMINPWSKRAKTAMLKAGFSEEQNFNARRMVASELLMLFLMLLGAAVAPPDKDDDEEEEEMSIAEGLIFYLSYRTLLEQQAFLNPSETYIQSGALMDFVPVGVAALMDLINLGYQGVGATVADEENSEFFYQSDDTKERYEEGDSKFSQHLIRLLPYVKSVWALEHPYEAKDNYEFGRKLRTR